MGRSCNVPGCKSTWRTAGISLYLVPSIRKHEGTGTETVTTRRRQTWLSKINNPTLNENKPIFVCSLHFVTGKPSYTMDVNSLDWAPSLALVSQTACVSKGLSSDNPCIATLQATTQAKLRNEDARKFCSITGCRNNKTGSAEVDDESVRYFDLPKVTSAQNKLYSQLTLIRRKVWMDRINVKDLNTKIPYYICSDHFISGKPAAAMSARDPDWIPSLKLPHSSPYKVKILVKTTKTQVNQLEDRIQREGADKVNSTQISTLIPSNPVQDHDYADIAQAVPGDRVTVLSTHAKDQPKDVSPYQQLNECPTGIIIKEEPMDDDCDNFVVEQNEGHLLGIDVKEEPMEDDSFVEESFEPCLAQAEDLVEARDARRGQNCEIEILKEKLAQTEDRLSLVQSQLCDITMKREVSEFCAKSFFTDDAKVEFYTGFTNIEKLWFLFRFMEDRMDEVSEETSSLPLFEQFCLTLISLRLNLMLQDVAYRFHMDRTDINAHLDRWISALFHSLVPAHVFWPKQNDIKQSLPAYFKKAQLINCVGIVVILELFPPLSHDVQRFCGKSVKYLVVFTPRGTVSFVSRGFLGNPKTSFMWTSSGVLENLSMGDLLVADGGCTLYEARQRSKKQPRNDVEVVGNDRLQLDRIKIYDPNDILSPVVHAHKMSETLKRRFAVLQAPVNFSTLPSTSNGIRWSSTDKILHVCCALHNSNPLS